MISMYCHGRSRLHRASAGGKICALFLFCTGVFFIPNLWGQFIALAGVIALYAVAGFQRSLLWQQLRKIWLFIVIIWVLQVFLVTVEVAFFVSVRLCTLVLAASLLTLTTRSSDMIATLEKALAPFSTFINVAQFSLAIALVLRFIPLIGHVFDHIRYAQKARSGKAQIWHVAGPAIIHTLKMSHDVADAIDARSFDIAGDS